jgi:hypothetical protein
MERLYRWAQISHLDVREADAAGELRAYCAGPLCSHAMVVTPGSLPAQVPLWILAARMRCRACGHKGAQLEVWGSPADAKFADRHAPAARGRAARLS